MLIKDASASARPSGTTLTYRAARSTAFPKLSRGRSFPITHLLFCRCMGKISIGQLIGRLVGGREADEAGDSGDGSSGRQRQQQQRGQREERAGARGAPEGARKGAQERCAGCGSV